MLGNIARPSGDNDYKRPHDHWRTKTLGGGLPENRHERGRTWVPPEHDRGITDVTTIFESVGIETPFPVLIRSTAETYEVDPEPENNWIYAALKGFQVLRERLEKERKKCRSFCTIGTGPGIDAIGAHYIFGPRMITLTDISCEAMLVALGNAYDNIPARRGSRRTSVGGMQSNLFQHMGHPALRGGGFDVIYGNIPNIPAKDLQINGTMAGATYVNKADITGAPALLDQYLLAHQWHFLRQATTRLADNGSVVMALGGRVPYPVIEELFTSAGYELEGLYSKMKRQTQPEEVIAGYAEAEKEGVTFTFYDLEKLEADPECPLDLEGNAEAVEQTRFAKYAVSAKEALALHRAGKPVGHLVFILRGQKMAN